MIYTLFGWFFRTTRCNQKFRLMTLESLKKIEIHYLVHDLGLNSVILHKTGDIRHVEKYFMSAEIRFLHIVSIGLNL